MLEIVLRNKIDILSYSQEKGKEAEDTSFRKLQKKCRSARKNRHLQRTNIPETIL